MRRAKCKKCGCVRLKVLKELNPDTTDMNMKTLVRCEKCGEEQEGSSLSYRYRELRSKGLVRI